MIIDAHVHLGEDVVFDETTTERDLLETYGKHHVDGGIVQPHITRPYIEDIGAAHDRIAEFIATAPGLWWGMASINPHLRTEEYDAEARRCIEKLGFVGIKLTPIGHACHPASRDGMHVFEICGELGVPLMIHTGSGIPFSDPVSVVKGVESFPDVPVVLAHAGSEMHHQQAILLARKYPNVYLEPSWVGSHGTLAIISSVDSSKILFSSDVVSQLPVELTKYRSIVDNEELLDKIFYKNAAAVYNLKKAFQHERQTPNCRRQ